MHKTINQIHYLCIKYSFNYNMPWYVEIFLKNHLFKSLFEITNNVFAINVKIIKIKINYHIIYPNRNKA